jgi:AraC-like DNA-binding protein
LSDRAKVEESVAAGLISPVSLPLEEAVERDSTGHGHAADRARRTHTAGAEAAKAPPAILPYIPLVRAIAIERMPELLDRMNVRFEDLLRRSGLPQVPLDHDTRFLPLYDVLTVVDRAARATGTEHFALLIANTGGFDALGDYGRYIKAAPTLLEAIRRAGRYISWHTLGARLSLTPEGASCVWRYNLVSGIRQNRQHAYLFALVLMRDVVRLAAGPQWFPQELRLEQSGSATYGKALEGAFGQRIRWAAGENALVLGQPLLALPLAWAPEAPSILTAADSARALASSSPSPDLVGSLRQLIRSFLPAGYPSASLLAHASGLPLRSFQRALALCGLSFSDLVEQVRFQLAVEMMRDPRLRLIDISLELGYSDAANFTRAFKRWTGQAPSQTRR